MRISATCLNCLVQKELDKIDRFTDEEQKASYLKEVMRLLVSVPESVTAPELVPPLTVLYREYFGEPRDFTKIKKEYNALMLSVADAVREKIRTADDPLLCAINYACVGNYIDFGTVKNVNRDELIELLEDAANLDLEKEAVAKLFADLAKAKTLVVLTDNCGEIVMDKLLIEQIKASFPQLSITAIVRGIPVINDATMEDAKEVGLDEIVPVIGNGSGCAGTALNEIADEAMEKLKTADVILSKGQGNFETLYGCGMNIHYLFLCKCIWFTKRFHMQPKTPVLVNEMDVKVYC